MDDRAAAEILALELREAMNKFLCSKTSLGVPEVEFRFTEVSSLGAPYRNFVANVSVRFAHEVSA